MKPWLFVGAKVVCVDNSACRRVRPGEIVPQVNVPYTVREILNEPDSIQIRLVEIVNPTYEFAAGRAEPSYNILRFRPLHDTSKTIEALRSLMLDATVRGKVTA